MDCTVVRIAKCELIASLSQKSKTKVTNFDITTFMDKNIFWLQISMYNAMRMEVVNTSDHLSEYFSNDFLRKLFLWVTQFWIELKISCYILKN